MADDLIIDILLLYTVVGFALKSEVSGKSGGRSDVYLGAFLEDAAPNV